MRLPSVFNSASILAAPPAYIVQAIPNKFYTQRVGSFIRDQSKLADVKAFFGQSQSIQRRPDGFIAYYAIQVYNHAQTFAYGEVVWHQLYLGPTSDGLEARITFSNLPYASSDEPGRDEPFDFRFPGIKFDAARGAFFASGRRGESIPVARFRGGPVCGWILS